jgi:undecaprenyl diphosphate synthase
VWALSIDNLSGRHPREIADLWDLCEEHLPQFSAQNQDALRQRGVSVRVIGERNLLPQRILAIVRDLEEKTHLNDPRIVLNIALPYGGREEIVAAATAKGPARISEGLYTKSSPDLIIRSGGERRLSGFLLWQSAHAELYFSSQLWPCFSQSHFLFALFDFQQRQRRFGR